jgi:hypothetical protein
MKRILVSVLSLVMLLTSCQKKEPPSEIVKRVEAAGAGDILSASRESLERWFKQHADIAQETRKACEKVKPSADVNWGDSTERRVCSAAASAMFFHHEPVAADKKTFP